MKRGAGVPACAAAVILLLGGLIAVAPPDPVHADHGCARAPWPSFREVAPSAERVVVGTVAEDLYQPDADPTWWFRLDVEEVLRGAPATTIEVRALTSGVPKRLATDPHCDENPDLQARVGDRIAIAFDGHMDDVKRPVTTVAFIEGRRGLNPGAERLTLAAVRRIAAGASDGSGLTAVKEKDGVKMRLTLAQDVLVAGKPAWITTTVRNTGDTPVRWTSDGCGISVLLQGKMVGQKWRPGSPLDVASIEAAGGTREADPVWRAKNWGESSRRMWFAFEPKWMVERGSGGCADVAIGRRLAPGEVVKQRLRWNGQVAETLGPPPDGTARIIGTFGYERRGDDRRRIALDLEVPVAGGRDPGWLHPREAVEAALTDPEFSDLIDPIRIGYESSTYLLHDAARDAWIVGLCGWFDDEHVWWKAAVVDPATGALAEIIDGPGDSTCDEGLPAPASRTDLAADAAASAQALTSLPGLPWPDAAIPASLAEFVPAAREQLWDQATDGLRLPLHLRFLEARCNSDGGVALVFEEIGPPIGTTTYAYAVRGSMPSSPDDDWGGGTGQTSVLDNPEFIHSMGTDAVACR